MVGVAALALSLIVVSGASSSSRQHRVAPLSHARFSAQKPIVVGASLSLTGSYASEAIGADDAMKLWVQNVNKSGGLLGRKVVLKVYDDQSDPAQAVRLYTKLITNDHANLLFGPFSSAMSAPVANVVEKYKFPTVLWGAGADAIFQQGFKNVFMVVGRGASTFNGTWALMKQFGYKTICMAGEDSESDKTEYPVYVQQAQADGFTVVSQDFYPPNTSTVASTIAKFKTAGCDVLFDASYEYDASLMLREAKAQDFNPKMIQLQEGPPDPSWIASMGPDANYVLGEEAWDPTLKTPGNGAFITAFKKEFNKSPDFVAALAYAGGQVLQAAVTKAGSLNLAAIRKRLATMTIQNITGTYKVGPGGIELQGGHFVVQVQNGKPQVVSPSSVATAKVQLPVPPWSSRP